MKRLILSLFLSITFLSYGICQSNTQQQIDYFIGQYNKYNGVKPYEKGATMLGSAASKALLYKDSHPYVIMRYALVEYKEKYGIAYPPGDDEKIYLHLIEDRYDRKRIDMTYKNTIIYVRTRLFRLKYIAPKYIPSYLMKMTDMLDKCPLYEEESKYNKYYDLIPKKITKNDKDELYAIIHEKAQECSGESWALEGMNGLLSGKTQQYIDKCLYYADMSNKSAADGFRFFMHDAKKTGTPEERQKLFDSAVQGKSVLASIMAADRIKATKQDEAMALLSAVEDSDYFSDYGGDLIKGIILEKNGNLHEIQQASLLLQKCMKNCNFKQLRNKAKELYKEYQTKIALLTLKEQEEMIDPYDALPAEYTALAAGYETLEGYEEKAMQFYRMAASLGDLRSICRVAIDDINKGILEDDPTRTINGAKVILNNSNSHFLPFIYNAACIILFGLDGNEPDYKKAEKLYHKFETKFEGSSTSNSYVKQDFLGIVRTLPQLPDLNFYDCDRAIQRYNEGLKYEMEGKYEDAENCYGSASFWGHPTGFIKADRIRNIRSEIRKKKMIQDGQK